MTRGGFLWAIGALLLIVALVWQVRYELGIRAGEEMAAGYLVPVCAGPIDAWILPVSLSAASLLWRRGCCESRVRAAGVAGLHFCRCGSLRS